MRIAFIPVLFLVAISMGGCLSGGGYPDSYASAYCTTVFSCFEQDSVDDGTGWDNAADCKEKIAEDLRQTSTYDAWEEGELSFNSEAASACIEEIREFQDDSDCDGRDLDLFSYALFVLDVTHEDCDSVYE
jgi:hypothetical protein